MRGEGAASMRVIVVASSKRAGAAFAAERGVKPVAIVTPRAREAARGMSADQVMEAPGLSRDDHDMLMAEVQPCIATAERGIDMVAATEKAIEAAKSHLTDADAGAIEALRALARKIDAWDQIVEWALDDAIQYDSRPAVPQNDNVSISAYLKYCDQLGLSPAGRKSLDVKGGSVSGKKAKLTALRGGKTA